jgi:hypothetical protein
MELLWLYLIKIRKKSSGAAIRKRSINLGARCAYRGTETADLLTEDKNIREVIYMLQYN